MKLVKLLFCTMWFATIFTGCKFFYANPSTQISATETLQASSSQIQSTDNPSSGVTLQVTPIHVTPTVSPSLKPNEAYSLLDQYLKNNSPCLLPCWGGITPGKSKLADAQRQLEMLSEISDYTYFGVAEDSSNVAVALLLYPIKESVVGISVGHVASARDGVVIMNEVRTQFFPKKNSTEIVYSYEEYNTLLSDYTLMQILKTYGLPNFIYTRAVIYPDGPKFFTIQLLYLDLGVFAFYEMPVEESGSNYQFCPLESTILLDLTPEDVGENYRAFFQRIGAAEWTSLEEPHYKLLEDALSMTNEEFSQAIISSPDACFETPIEIWPDS